MNRLNTDTVIVFLTIMNATCCIHNQFQWLYIGDMNVDALRVHIPACTKLVVFFQDTLEDSLKQFVLTIQMESIDFVKKDKTTGRISNTWRVFNFARHLDKMSLLYAQDKERLQAELASFKYKLHPPRCPRGEPWRMSFSNSCPLVDLLIFGFACSSQMIHEDTQSKRNTG